MPVSVEKIGIEHVGKALRHGREFSLFTLWFAANLTIADFALGGLLRGMDINWAVFVILVGNILGGTLLGLMAAMGPSFGYPQMLISKAMFGKKTNVVLAALNWLSTVGWFTVNIILGGKALSMLGFPFYAGVILLVVVQVIIVIYGHDFIHHFERWMAVVLGILFLVVMVLSLKHVENLGGTSPGIAYIAGMTAVVFSYLMSWSPYASDYSRYLPESASKFKIFLYTFLGGAIASAWLEFIGYIVSKESSLSPIASIPTVMGHFAPVALLAVVFGVITANSLNLYTNSLSALVVYSKTDRIVAVFLAAAVGLILCIPGASDFERFYSDFLITLDYWITPWIGVMLAMFFVKGIRKGVENSPDVVWTGVISYVVGLACSVPFMNLTYYGIPYEGVISNLLGGSDISYFVSFAVAFLLASFMKMSNTVDSSPLRT